MGWASGFESGVNSASKLIQIYQAAKQQQELSGIADAKPENSTGFTAQQGSDLQAAADSGQYDIGFDEGKGAYTVTPKSDPSQVGVIAKQGVTDFLGNRTTTMDPAQVDSARQRAMAGVLMKTDPVTGIRLMREAKLDDQNEQRFAWDKSRNEREIRQGDQAEKDQGIIRDVDQQTADWFKNRLTGDDGKQRAATVDDHLAASQFRAGKLTEAGKVQEAGKVIADHNAQALVKIQLDSAQRDQDLAKTAAALNAGDLGAVKDFYNKYVPDGARVTNVTRDATGHINIERETMDGRKMPPTVMKDTGQMVSALASFKDPMALYNWSQNEFRNNLALRADSRAGAAEGRAQAEFDSKGSVRDAAEAEADLRLKIANADDSTPEGKAEIQRTQAKLLALKTGMRGAMAGHDPADIVKARTLVAQGVYPSEGEALDALVSKPDKLYQTYKDAAMKTTMNADASIESAKKMMADDGWVRSSSGTWKRAGGATSKIESDPKALAIRDDKTLSLDQKRAKLKELGYQ